MDKIPKDGETESISISRISVQAIQIVRSLIYFFFFPNNHTYL